MTAELSKEETIVFLTLNRPLGFLSRLGVSIKGMGFLFPQGQCSTTVAAMAVGCLAFLRRNSGSPGASLKWKPPPFKILMPEIAHARAGHSLVDDFYSVSYCRELYVPLGCCLSVLLDKPWAAQGVSGRLSPVERVTKNEEADFSTRQQD